MHAINSDLPSVLADAATPPCLSLYQTTHRHHPENQQDPIRFRNLVKGMETQLGVRYKPEVVTALMEPFHTLADDHDFWGASHEGLAVLRSKESFRVVRLQRPVADQVVVADSFHLKPLMRVQQAADRYQVLGLSRSEFRLYEGNRDVLDEIAPDERIARTMSEALGDELTDKHQAVAVSGGTGAGQPAMHHGIGSKEVEVANDDERFFRLVAKGILEHHSRPSGLPLILATLPEHRELFHRVSHNPFLMSTGIDHYPGTMSHAALREQAWQVVEPQIEASLRALTEAYGTARANALGDDNLEHVARAITNGQVATLLIDAEREIPGTFDLSAGTIRYADVAYPDVDDVLDDLAESALRRGGRVVVMPSDQMPSTTGIAAIYRYAVDESKKSAGFTF
jgi:hypothetical protein